MKSGGLMFLLSLLTASACASPAVPSTVPTASFFYEQPQQGITPTIPQAKPPTNTLTEDVVPACDARRYVGRTVIAEGVVVASRYFLGVNGRPFFLYFGATYPNHCLGVAILASDRSKFPDHPGAYYLNRMIRVTGLIETYEGKPVIILHDAEQIALLD